MAQPHPQTPEPDREQDSPSISLPETEWSRISDQTSVDTAIYAELANTRSYPQVIPLMQWRVPIRKEAPPGLTISEFQAGRGPLPSSASTQHDPHLEPSQFQLPLRGRREILDSSDTDWFPFQASQSPDPQLMNSTLVFHPRIALVQEDSPLAQTQSQSQTQAQGPNIFQPLLDSLPAATMALKAHFFDEWMPCYLTFNRMFGEPSVNLENSFVGLEKSVSEFWLEMSEALQWCRENGWYAGEDLVVEEEEEDDDEDDDDEEEEEEEEEEEGKGEDIDNDVEEEEEEARPKKKRRGGRGTSVMTEANKAR